jgi:hypothetical protein
MSCLFRSRRPMNRKALLRSSIMEWHWKKSRAAPPSWKRPIQLGGLSSTRTLDLPIKSTNQRIQSMNTDELSSQQLDLSPDSP